MPLLADIEFPHLTSAMRLGLAAAGAALIAIGCSSDKATGATARQGAGGSGTTSASTTGASMATGGAGAGGSAGTGGRVDCGPKPTGKAPALKLTKVASGLSDPLLATGAPGDPSRLFIVERGGAIKILSGGSVLAKPFLDLNAIVHDSSADNEFGLLGLAFHPKYAQNGRFFVFYVANNGDSTLAEYARSSSPDVANPQAVRTLLTITGDNSGQHYGGMLAFGNDGYLYVSSGDRGADSGPPSAQDIKSQRGKILRLDVDAFPKPPPGNMPGGDPYVWDYGLRNPWRFSVDRCSGDLYIGDVGGAFEEINVEPAGQGHKNYGWPTYDTGTTCRAPDGCSGVSLATVADAHNTNNCSFIGGYVYRGSLIPGLSGRYLYGDWCSGRIFSLVWSEAGVTLAEELSANLDTANVLSSISSFGEDAAGNLFVVDLIGRSVYRIDAK